MVERRRHSRERAFQAASIASPRLAAETHCVVRDLSDGGALLLVDEPRRTPSEFTLTLARGGEARLARVVWRGDAGVGVAFGHASASGEVVSLDAARRARGGDPDVRRLADRIAGVLRPRPRPEA